MLDNTHPSKHSLYIFFTDLSTNYSSFDVADETNCGKDEKQIKKSKKSKKEKVKEHKEEDGKSADSKHSPSKVIKQKFMTLRHSAKKLSPKIPH